MKCVAGVIMQVDTTAHSTNDDDDDGDGGGLLQLELTGVEITWAARITVTARRLVHAVSADEAFDCIPTANTASVYGLL